MRHILTGHGSAMSLPCQIIEEKRHSSIAVYTESGNGTKFFVQIAIQPGKRI